MLSLSWLHLPRSPVLFYLTSDKMLISGYPPLYLPLCKAMQHRGQTNTPVRNSAKHDILLAVVDTGSIGSPQKLQMLINAGSGQALAWWLISCFNDIRWNSAAAIYSK